MTTLQQFIEHPWENRNLHEAYRNSFLGFGNAPEYAPSEVLLGSLYRRIGLRQGSTSEPGSGNPLPERSVGKNGTALMRLIERRNQSGQPGAKLSVEGWSRVIDDVIRSPRQPNQRAKKFVQMTPIVPSAAIYSMAARLRGNPWNPGGLIESCLCLGERSEEKAEQAWNKLFRALSVNESDDDVWAVFLEQEFSAWSDGKTKWSYAGSVNYDDWMQDWQKGQVACPARRFVADLAHVIQAKPVLTRRQWTSVLESILRIGIGAHVLWVSKVNHELYGLAESVLRGGSVPGEEEVRRRLSTGDGFWSYGQLVGPHIKKLVRNYMCGRVGLNMLLHRCGQVGGLDSLVAADARPFGTVESICSFLGALDQHRAGFEPSLFQADLNSALEADPRKLAIKQGIGKNIEEFLRHSLGQRETQERGLESYDQGYLLSRRGTYSRAPWILAAGPVMILSLAYSCASDGSGTRTVEDLCNHLADYGIKISPDDVADSELGSSLRTLGLVLDSPDAEGGMVLLNPFPSSATKSGDTI